MTDDTREWLDGLAAKLTPAYALGSVVPGHDVTHVQRMCARIPLVTHLPGLDPDELAAAVWLHNLDRAPALGIPYAALGGAARRYLEFSPFGRQARTRIAFAVAVHDRRTTLPSDPDVLRALKALDKTDRMNVVGVLTGAMTHGLDKPLYEARNPFRYRLTADGQPYTVYDDLAGRIMEFPRLIEPEARYLIDVPAFRRFVAYVRDLAGYICQVHGLANGIEDDLRKALGSQYETFAG